MSSKAAPLVMYIVVRKDLLRVENWPVGAVMTQACHAVSAALWTFREREETKAYMADMDSMRKVCLELEGEAELRSLWATLEGAGLEGRLWVEMPEDVPVAIALRPYPKPSVHPHLKHLKLFS